MMTTALKNGLRLGLIFGFIFTFLILIGFIHVGTTIIGNMLGNIDSLTEDTQLPVVNLLIFIALMGLLAGAAAQKNVLKLNWLGILLTGLTTGLFAGLMAGTAIYFIGLFHMEGVDFRTYLPNLSPKQTSYLLFYSTPPAAALTYLMYFAFSGLAGALLARSLSSLSGLKKILSDTQDKVMDYVGSPKIRRVLNNKLVIIGLMVIIAVVLYFLPFLWGSYWNYIMGTVAIYILLGLGLNIIVGYSGQLVLGYVAFFATGSYTFALLTAPEPHAIGLNLWLAVGISILVSILTGLLLGLPILSLRGDYLAIVTLGFGEIVRILIRSDFLTPLTNGPKGITSIGQPTWRNQIFSDINYMHLLMLLVLAGLFVAKRLKDSRTGRAWIAIREDQTVAQATGVNTYRYKLLALILGAAFAGLSGALFASRNQFTGPEDFTLMVSVNVLCIVIVGGMGSLPGVILGAFVLKGIPELLRELADYRLLVFGALLVVMMIVRPEGLWPVRKRIINKQALPPDPTKDSTAGEVEV
jgi:ABC-type branched-subunit amino acid transport system permease subunit